MKTRIAIGAIVIVLAAVFVVAAASSEEPYSPTSTIGILNVRSGTCNTPFELNTWDEGRSLVFGGAGTIQSTNRTGTAVAYNINCHFRPPDYSTLHRLTVYGEDDEYLAQITNCLYYCHYSSQLCTLLACAYSDFWNDEWQSSWFSHTVNNGIYTYMVVSWIPPGYGDDLRVDRISLRCDTD